MSQTAEATDTEEQISFHGRVYATPQQKRYITLFNFETNHQIVLNVYGYSDRELQQTVRNEIEKGHVIRGTCRVSEENQYGLFTDVEIVARHRLAYCFTEDSTYGETELALPPLEEHENKDVVSAELPVYGDSRQDELATIEVQRQLDTIEYSSPEQVPSVYQGEELPIRKPLLQEINQGNILVEPFFTGDGTNHIGQAEAVIALDPQDRDVVYFYLFETVDNVFERVLTALRGEEVNYHEY